MIKIENLTKYFDVEGGEPVVAADRVTFEVGKGEICILLGPSGCGKTTTLKMINKLIPKTSGKIFVDGKDIDEIDSIELRRNLGYVIQQIGLFPNMTIEDNICIVPDLLKMDRKESRKKAVELLEMVNLDPKVFIDRYPRELSGGQQQRIGVVRALAADPPIILMDEPFSAIDPINRAVIQDEFINLNRNLHKTVMMVSHDIDEAVKMADKVAIFKAGKLVQFGSPEDILGRPKNDFIKDFIGKDSALKRLYLLKVHQGMIKFPVVAKSGDNIGDIKDKMIKADADIAVVGGGHGRLTGYLHIDTVKNPEISDSQAGDQCYRLPHSVTKDDKLRDVVSQMYSEGTDWLPVVDEHDKYIGYITQHIIAGLLGSNPESPEE